MTGKLVASRAAFDEACAGAGVPPEHRDSLYRIHATWPPAGTLAERLAELFQDYGHWRLFVRSADGDAAASREFERYWRKAATRFLGRGFAADQVDEFAGAFFERAYRAGASFRHETAFTVYLRTILLNLARDEARRRGRALRREVALDLGASDPKGAPRIPSPEDELLAAERRVLVERALAALAPVDLHIVLECLVEGRSGQELAADLGMSRDALYQRLRRAKVALRRALADASSSARR